MIYEYSHNTMYGNHEATTEVWIDHDQFGLTIDTSILVNYNPNQRSQVEQCVVAVLPDDEAIKLRDYLLSKYPLEEL